MKAVVMAGGEGTRLRPLTCNLSKPMVPVMDKPVMEYALQLLKKYGITDIAVTLQYLPDTIRDYFGDGSEWGLNLHYYVEESPLGTAGSVKNAQEFLDEPFIVISGDALTDFNLQTAIDFHRSQGALATLVLTVRSPSAARPIFCSIICRRLDKFLATSKAARAAAIIPARAHHSILRAKAAAMLS